MSQYTEPGTAGGAGRSTGPSGWVGWISFAGVMMIVLGSLHFMEGLVAVFNDEYFLVGQSGLVVSVDYTAWGWVHMLAGVVVVAAGLGVLVGQVWARVIGVAVAAVSIIVNVAFMGAYPFWSLTMIALDIVVIMALTVHGSEVRAGE